ncbi:uncharacterized protein LOC115441519 [Manduca sexta]|uniref:uncharacterized protein LOC115441519 n=1 Tax=Manduca sexta TaxID=7130 RepID=UPI00188EA8D8|nr:uncharacterized protein LOC115441519 [Manduca sexta]
MEIRYKYILAVTTLLSSCVSNEKINADTDHSKEKDRSNCPFSKIVEDIFNIHNKSSENKVYAEDKERAKLFLHSIANVTSLNESRTQEELVNSIIASINRIKNDIKEVSKNETKLNEAIIINPPNDQNLGKDLLNNGPKIVSGVEERVDTVKEHTIAKKTHTKFEQKTTTETTVTEKIKYMEVLTIEPNNTHVMNTSSNNIIEVLKHLMPMFNNSLMTYCDKENLTKPNFANIENDEIPQYDEYEDDEDIGDDNDSMNMTIGEKKDIMEAAEYGMRKMHELYSVLEPKLYSMGLWLDDTNPARYVAAFNAPSEDAAKFSRYGYATLQAATRLRQLTR